MSLLLALLDSGITGTASITEEDDTLTAAAALAVSAVLAVTEADDTLSAEGTIADVTVARRPSSARYRLAVAEEEKRRQRKLRIEEIAEEIAEPVAAEPVVIKPRVEPRKITEPELARIYLAATPREKPTAITIARPAIEEAVDLVVAKENAMRIRLREDDDLFLMAA